MMFITARTECRKIAMDANATSNERSLADILMKTLQELEDLQVIVEALERNRP